MNNNFEVKMDNYFEMDNKDEMTNMNNTCCNMPDAMPGVVCPPVYECPQERVCHRYICHEVPHIKPCNTRIINHHIYRHTFTPCYTCCEENEVSNVYENNNCCF